jgi:hypothetical protein
VEFARIQRKGLNMRVLIWCGGLLLMCGTITAAQDNVYGFTNRQLQSAFRTSGLATQRLYCLQTFGAGDTEDPAYLAVLSGSRSVWHVSVFHRVQGGFKLEWISRKLPLELSVSSPGQFSIVDVGEESTVIFSGCAPHRCGGDYHGFLLYSTVRKEAFFALLAQQEDKSRRLTFSDNALEPANKDYKEALQRAADEMTRSADLSN